MSVRNWLAEIDYSSLAVIILYYLGLQLHISDLRTITFSKMFYHLLASF